MKPVRLELILDDKTLKGIMSVEGNLDRVKKFQQATIASLQTQLKGLEKDYKRALSAGTADDAQLAQIQALTGKIAMMREELKNLGETQKEVASKPLMADDAAPKMKNLQTSMAQIARELPSLAMGPQMFFMAISNNIPMLQDAITSARTEYERATAAGDKATPVWKQVLSGLVNWQTALAVGITLLVMYGDEIADWVSELFNGKDAALSLAEANEKLNDSMAEDSKELAGQITLVKSLAERWKALGGNLAAEQRFLKDNKEELNKLAVAVDDVSQAENLFERQTSAYITAMELRARATAAYNLAVEEQEGVIKKQIELEKRKLEGPTFVQKYGQYALGAVGALLGRRGGMLSPGQLFADEIKGLKGDITEGEEAASVLRSIQEKALKEMEEVFKKAGFTKNSAGTKAVKNYAEELAEARDDADRRAEKARIAIMQEGMAKRKALAALEHKEELARINKEEKEQLTLLKKAKENGQKVSASAENEITSGAAAERVVANEKYLRELAAIEKEWQEEGVQAWIDYNKRYGTIQEQRAAIAKEYGRKIANAQHEGEQKALMAAMQEELRAVNMKELTESIDFADVFGRLDQMSTDALRSLREKLREYIETMDGELNATDLKTLQDALNRIERSITGRRPAASLKDSFNALVAAQKEVAEAQGLVDKAQGTGETVVQKYDQATGELTTEVISLADAEEKLEKAENKQRKAMGDLGEAAGALAKDMRDVYNAAASITGSLEPLGMDVSGDLSNVIDGFGQATEGLEEFAMAAMTGNVFGMVSGGVKALAGQVKMLGSAFGADWGGEKSRERYERAKEMYESYMSVLDRVIEKQKELVASMDGSDFMNANNSYERAKELLKAQEEAARQMGRNYLNSGASSGFLGIGSSSSQGVKQRDRISEEGWSQVRDKLGYDTFWSLFSDGRMSSLFSMSYEDLVKLRDEAPLFYSQLHEDTRMYVDQVIAAGEAWKEIEETREEALTKVSFEDFKRGYLDLLADLDATNEDFAKNFEKYLQRALLESMMETKYADRVRDLYDAWVAAYENDGTVDKGEAADLKKMNNDLTAAITAERDAMAKTYGWDSAGSQSGRTGNAITITEETAGRLEGIGNAMLDHVATIDDTSVEIGETLAGAAGSLATIAENSSHLKRLDEIADNIKSMNFSGVKLKN